MRVSRVSLVVSVVPFRKDKWLTMYLAAHRHYSLLRCSDVSRERLGMGGPWTQPCPDVPPRLGSITRFMGPARQRYVITALRRLARR